MLWKSVKILAWRQCIRRISCSAISCTKVEAISKGSSLSWILNKINSYGYLRVACPDFATIIKPTSVDTAPYGDKAYVTLELAPSWLENTVSVCYENDVLSISQSSLAINATEKDQLMDTAVLVIEVPHLYDVKAEVKNLKISDMQCSQCFIKCRNGSAELSKLKAGNIHLDIAGSVSCANYVHGNGSIHASHNVKLGKFQGVDIAITSEHGFIEIESAYAKHMSCTSKSGSMKMGSIHGQVNLSAASGDIDVSSMTGNLDVKSNDGNVSVNLEKDSSLAVVSNTGDISVGLSEDAAPDITVEAACIDVPEEIIVDGVKRHDSAGKQFFEGKIGAGKDSISVKAPLGSVRFQNKSWFSSFNANHIH